MTLRNRKVYINELEKVWFPIWRYRYGANEDEENSYIDRLARVWILKHFF
jgi:hypothetical protein